MTAKLFIKDTVSGNGVLTTGVYNLAMIKLIFIPLLRCVYTHPAFSALHF